MPEDFEIIVYRNDVPLEPILSRKVAVIGYGNQGRAHALNLRDSGVEVFIGLRGGSPSRVAAEYAGFNVFDIKEAVATAEVVSLLIPDEAIPGVFAEEVVPTIKPGSFLLFAHGAAVHFGAVVPDGRYNVILVAPMGPGKHLRELYLAGSGLNAKAAVHLDVTGVAWDITLAYARALGCTRAGVISTTFEEETVLDLFSEQAVLCGGIPALAEAAFDTLVQAGYPPALAYVECVREIKYIADILYESGLSGMRERISFTALYGGLTRGNRIIDGRIKETLSAVLDEIRDGRFYEELSRCDKTRAVLAAEVKNEDIERGRSAFEKLCVL